MDKTIGELIDELSVTNLKIWHLVERVEAKTNTVEDGWKMNKLVAYRSKLISAINDFYGQNQIIKVYESDGK